MADADDCSGAAVAAVVPSELSSTGEEEVSSAAEMDLGLTLRTSKAIGGSGMACRILTAEDLGSRSPISSSSSVSSSSPAPSLAGAGWRTPPPSHHLCQMARGWPPIKTCRMNSLSIHSKNCTSEAETSIQKKINKIVKEEMDGNNQVKVIRCIGSMHFIKVNMDGDPIGRKVDLNAHNSYETLALALEDMFSKSNNDCDTFAYGFKASQLLDGSSGFSLTYEDRDGDWMLVGDVPWGMFLITVKRLRIMKTSDAIGLAESPKSQFRKSVGPRSIPA